MQELNPSFNIQSPEIYFTSAQLFAEAGPMGVSLVVLRADNFFNAVIIYPFATGLNDTEITENLNSAMCAMV